MIALDRPRVLHVTEALGGGLLEALSLLARSQVAAGAHVEIVYKANPDTPSHEVLARFFGPRVSYVELPAHAGVRAMAIRSLIIRRHVRRLCPDYLHVHSSVAGVISRLAVVGLLPRARVFYTPHGYAFLRRDVSWVLRLLFFVVEFCLGRLIGSSILVSPSEAALAARVVGKRRSRLVVNAIDTANLGVIVPQGGVIPRVLTCARITYAKAPWRFSAIADELLDEAVFTWIGSARSEVERGWLGNSVSVTGWLEGPAVHAELASGHLYVSTSLWEGLPIALLEAQALGLPAIVTDVSGNRDVVQHGETGFIARSDAELAAYVRLLVSDPGLRAEMGAKAAQYVRRHFDSGRLGPESLTAYAEASR